MNYDDYYARHVGGALPYFSGARVQKGHGFGSSFSGLLLSVAPLIKRGALALGKGALTTGAQIAGDVVAGQNIKKATKRRATAAGTALMSSLLATPPPPGKRIKRTAPPTKRIKLTAPRRRTSLIKRQPPDVFSYDGIRTPTIVRRSEERTGLVRRTTDADQYRRRWLDRTPTIDISRLGWPDRINLARNRRRISRSRQHISTRTREK